MPNWRKVRALCTGLVRHLEDTRHWEARYRNLAQTLTLSVAEEHQPEAW